MADIFDTAGSAGVADERATLEAFLDFYRNAVKAKVRGLSDEDARRKLVSSATTLAGLIKHLRRVEASWFQHRLDRVPIEDLPALRNWDRVRENDFLIEPDESVEDLLALYDEQCALSRKAAARYGLDEVISHPEADKLSLRWIYVHMIEETARHAGHADILREQIDGTTGD